MAARAILVVVVAADAGLRSALAAHLSLDGLDLLTASNIGYGLLGSSMIRKPSLLVIDETLIPCDADRWIEKQRGFGTWRYLVLLTEAAPASGERGDWLVRVAQGTPRKRLAELIAGFARDDVPN